MILPSGNEDLLNEFIDKSRPGLIGCLSFEERSIKVPLVYGVKGRNVSQHLIRVDDPIDAFPNYGDEIARRTDVQRRMLKDSRVDFKEIALDLLATEDELLDLLQHIKSGADGGRSLILDITSLPKRVFCLLLKRMLLGNWCEDLLVTYTTAGTRGYTKEHLSTDALPCDHLPGMAGKVSLGEGTLIVSLGFEELNIRSIMEEYHGRDDTNFIMSYPTNFGIERRQWAMLRQLLPANHGINPGRNLWAIAGWDAEQVYRTLNRLKASHPKIVMAPFGIKTHTLGMALFAIQNDSGLFYTQPKSYHPSYTIGFGTIFTYLVKWRGLAAYDREIRYP